MRRMAGRTRAMRVAGAIAALLLGGAASAQDPPPLGQRFPRIQERLRRSLKGVPRRVERLTGQALDRSARQLERMRRRLDGSGPVPLADPRSLPKLKRAGQEVRTLRHRALEAVRRRQGLPERFRVELVELLESQEGALGPSGFPHVYLGTFARTQRPELQHEVADLLRLYGDYYGRVLEAARSPQGDAVGAYPLPDPDHLDDFMSAAYDSGADLPELARSRAYALGFAHRTGAFDAYLGWSPFEDAPRLRGYLMDTYARPLERRPGEGVDPSLLEELERGLDELLLRAEEAEEPTVRSLGDLFDRREFPLSNPMPGFPSSLVMVALEGDPGGERPPGFAGQEVAEKGAEPLAPVAPGEAEALMSGRLALSDRVGNAAAAPLPPSEEDALSTRGFSGSAGPPAPLEPLESGEGPGAAGPPPPMERPEGGEGPGDVRPPSEERPDPRPAPARPRRNPLLPLLVGLVVALMGAAGVALWMYRKHRSTTAEMERLRSRAPDAAAAGDGLAAVAESSDLGSSGPGPAATRISEPGGGPGPSAPEATRVSDPGAVAPVSDVPATRPGAAPPANPGDRPAGGALPGWLRSVLEGSVGERYTELTMLGAGGMGTVVRAWDARLERPVAIKVPPPHLSGHAEFRERFLREARALARLGHDNIARVYDVPDVPEGEVPLMIMEYLEGDDLLVVLERKGVPELGKAFSWVLQAGKGLLHAHEQGIVHRDIKPGNLMLVGGERVKILDFGLAALEDGPGLTRSGVLMGSIPYMPPEQLRGEKVGPEADQYALAVTAFQLFTGRLPFASDDAQRLQPPRASAVRSGFPPQLDAVLGRALHPMAGERWPDLQGFLQGLVDSARAARTARSGAPGA